MPWISGGRGKSEGERFYVEKFSDYLGDVDRLVRQARSENPGLPVFVLGHSAGGVIAASYVFEHQNEIAGLISESFAYDVGLAECGGDHPERDQSLDAAPPRLHAEERSLLA
jgi:alpha-beta hydrolase superfamily lysophospholipase